MFSRFWLGYVIAALALGPAAFAQEVGLLPSANEQSRSSSGPAVIVRAGESEILQPERGAVTPTMTPPLPLEAPIDAKTYVCGRGDVFDLNFWGQQNFKVRVAVDLEGRTFIPKVGYVDVVGKTLADARELIRKAVHRYYPGLSFDVSLAAPRTFLVHIVGLVDHPGEYVATAVERVASVLSRATATTAPTAPATSGPPGSAALLFETRGNVATNPATVVGSRRRIDIKSRSGVHRTADLTLYDVTGDVKYNPVLSDGDVVTVPAPESVVTLDGAVNRSGRYELISTRDLAELLTVAGGLKRSVTRSLPIRIIRRGRSEHWTETRIDFPTGGAAPNVALHDGDIIHVPDASELQRIVTIVGPVAGAANADEVTAVRRVPFYEGATAGRLVEQIGGVGASADLAAAYIRHEDGTFKRVDLEAVLVRRDFGADRPIGVGDSIVVPQKRRGVAVEGAVIHPSLYPYNPDFRAGDYVSVAGGVRSSARPESEYRVITPTGQQRKFNVKLTLDPGDTIVVPERSFTRSEVVQLVMGGVGLALSTFTLVFLLVTR